MTPTLQTQSSVKHPFTPSAMHSGPFVASPVMAAAVDLLVSQSMN